MSKKDKKEVLKAFKAGGGKLIYGMNHNEPIAVCGGEVITKSKDFFKGISKEIWDNL